MKRMILLLTIAVLIAVMVGANAAPLSAQPPDFVDVEPEPFARCLDPSVDLPNRFGCLNAAGGFEEAGPFLPFPVPIEILCRINPDFSPQCGPIFEDPGEGP